MLHRIFSTIIAVVCCIAASAQGTCVIKGTIGDGDKKVKSVTLVRANDLGLEVEVATAKVKKGKFTFKYELAKDEPVQMYTIKGLSQDVEVFVEPGEVSVVAGNPGLAWGTPANDVFFKYKEICMEEYVALFAKEKELAVKNGEEWLESADGKAVTTRVKALEAMKNKSARIKFLIDHNDSPMTPLEIERTLFSILTPAYAEQMLNTVAVSLHGHPYYISLRNKVLANSLKVGNEVPDIQLPLINGEKKQLADFRGKYVVLNFWANGSDKSDMMIEELQNLYDVVQDSLDKIAIVSYALESDKDAWKAAVNSNNMEREGWLNACDGAGTDSPAAKLLGVENAPRIIIVEPEGRAVSMDMDVDELIIRIEQILSGDLYYLDQEK